MKRIVVGWLVLSTLACVPDGPPSAKREAPSTQATATIANANKGKSPPPRPASSGVQLPNDPPLSEPFEDNFERQELGDDWRALSTGWRIVDGMLCGEKARNRGLWFAKKLPVNARIEFDAIAKGKEGDIKAEFFGDGITGATGTSYTNATSYLTIFGGWNNKLHVLARLNEHGTDRHTRSVETNADDERQRPVSPGQLYHFKVERNDGSTLTWEINDLVMHEIVDPVPLAGLGHDHFGFNNWESPVCFDNVKIIPL